MSQVLNAAMLYWPMHNTLYVEGYALDRFAEGSWALQPVHQNKVSVALTRDVGLAPTNIQIGYSAAMHYCYRKR